MKTNILDDQFISRLENLAFLMQQPMRGFFGGNHRTKSYGQTVEFADFREYVLGDDLRHIDWNLYSRFEKHFVKLFVDERQMLIQIFMDCSASMAKVDILKAELMLKVAATLGYLSVHSLDKVAFQVMHGNNAKNIAGLITGKDAFYRSILKLEEIEFYGEVNVEKAVTGLPSPGSNDGLTVIISDFLTESNWKKAVDYLIFQKREVLLIQILSLEDLDPKFNGRMRLLDAEALDVLDAKNMRIKITKGHRLAYQEALQDYLEDIKVFANKRGVHYISVLSDEIIERFVFQRLAMLGTVK